MPPDPVNVTSGDGAFKHTALVPAIFAIGKGLIVMMAVADCNCEQAVEDPSRTLTKV